MNIPIELICKIISYIPKKKCYRCNKQITPLDKQILCYNNEMLYFLYRISTLLKKF